MLTDLIYYDLKVAALIAVFYLFYMLLLARETTHTLNRAVLLSGIVLSAVLPLCIITIHEKPHPQPLPRWGGEYIDMLAEGPQTLSAEEVTTPLSLGEGLGVRLLAAILLVGIIVRLVILARGYWRLHCLIASGERHTLPAGIRVCVVDVPVAPFSWMHTIVLSRADWNGSAGDLARNTTHGMWAGTPALPPILAHEEAHVRHRHSYDIVVVEVLTALQWFNPVVWFLRQELRTLHEYEADASVLSRGFDESQYIHLLMQKATGIQACALARSTLVACFSKNGIRTHKTKKRILMMLKPKSNRVVWLKALYIVPVVLGSLAMTARTVVDYETAATEDDRAVSLFHENTNGRGDTYQIRHAPGVKFYHNGKEEAIPGDRPIALTASNTTMHLDGTAFDEHSLPDLPVSALREIHLDATSPGHAVCNLVTNVGAGPVPARTANVGASPVPARNKTTMNDAEFVNYVKQQQVAGLKQSDLVQSMLNEGNGISRARILHLNGVCGSEKGNLLVVDGKEVSREDFNRVEPEAIASVTVMDVGPAKKVFGEKGRYGATVIETKPTVTEAPQPNVRADEFSPSGVRADEFPPSGVRADGFSPSGQDVFDVCEQMPTFPGGDAKLMEFISRNIKYPEVATKNGVQGRVLVQFIVEKDGSLTNAKILDNPKSSPLNMVVDTAMMPDKERQDAEAHNAGVQALRDEAIRVISAMPRWTPGKQKGKAVRCHFVIPVTYRLQ